MRKAIGLVLTGAVILYLVACLGIYAAMRQPPEKFGAIMSKVPGVAMMILPFEPLWMNARAGKLRVGDAAPDFDLPTLDHRQMVRLSDEYRQKPVALIFGSYT